MLTTDLRIRITVADHDGSNAESDETTIAAWLDMNDPENEDVRDACIRLMAGEQSAVLTDQASVYTIEAIQ